MSTEICDHTSVGMLVWNGDKLLMIERKKFPAGFAPPAGHVDEHGSFEQAAIDEIKEEVGLTATKLDLILEGRRENACRREDGSWHYWKIYRIKSDGELKRNESETKQAHWFDGEELRKFAKRTEDYRAGQISEESWQATPGLEEVWYDFFKELNII